MPPTPGPVAVANIVDVPLGWIILFGILLGLPTVAISGPVFGKFIAKIYLKVPPEMNVTSPDIDSGDFPLSDSLFG